MTPLARKMTTIAEAQGESRGTEQKTDAIVLVDKHISIGPHKAFGSIVILPVHLAKSKPQQGFVRRRNIVILPQQNSIELRNLRMDQIKAMARQ